MVEHFKRHKYRDEDRIIGPSLDAIERSYLFSDIYNWLKVFWWTNIFKMRQLTEGLAHSYNTNNFLTWLVLARSSLEYAAVNYYFVKKIKQFDIRGPNLKFSAVKGVEDNGRKFALGIHKFRHNSRTINRD